MAVRIALCRAREENAQQRDDSIWREFIAYAQMALRSDARRATVHSPEAVRSVWRPNVVVDVQPLRWRADDEATHGPLRALRGVPAV